MTADAIRIDGLKEFQRALKLLEDGAQKKLKTVLNEAADIVADEARRHVPVRSGQARATMRAASQQRYAIVSAGGRKVPYYAWLDFGGNTGRNGSAHRPFLRRGRYMYPAYFKLHDDIITTLSDGLARLAQEVGLTVDRAA